MPYQITTKDKAVYTQVGTISVAEARELFAATHPGVAIKAVTFVDRVVVDEQNENEKNAITETK